MCFKALGPDGFQPIFYKMYWEEVGDDVWNFFKQTFETSTIDPKATDTLVVCITKVDTPRMFKDFRPIILCNVIYKLVTKVLVNRMRPLLQRLVSLL